MKIVVLGAGGFIGSHMVTHLALAGEHRVVAVDVSSEKLHDAGGERVAFHHLDVRRDLASVDRLIRDADLVVDLVAHANPSIYVTSPLEVFELNFVTNLDIVRLCIRHGKRLVQFSSAEAYGKLRDGAAYSEDTSDVVFGPVSKQRWIYGAAKTLLERVIHAHGLAGDLEYTIIRPFNFLGSRMDYLVPAGTLGGPRVFPHFLSALLTGGPLRLVNGGLAHRAFLHVDDGMAAFQTVIDHPEQTRNEIYNVGNPANDIAIRDLASLMIELFRELTGIEPVSVIEEIDGEDFYGAGYDDASRLPPDITKMRALGWAPRHDLRATLLDVMGEYLAEREATVHTPAAVRRTATL